MLELEYAGIILGLRETPINWRGAPIGRFPETAGVGRRQQRRRGGRAVDRGKIEERQGNIVTSGDALLVWLALNLVVPSTRPKPHFFCYLRCPDERPVVAAQVLPVTNLLTHPR